MKLYDQGEQLKRIADALELVIQMVKKDQEKFERYKEETTEKWDKEAAQWAAGPGQQWPAFTCSIGDGSWIRDQATSSKPQAASNKQQAWQD